VATCFSALYHTKKEDMASVDVRLLQTAIAKCSGLYVAQSFVLALADQLSGTDESLYHEIIKDELDDEDLYNSYAWILGVESDPIIIAVYVSAIKYVAARSTMSDAPCEVAVGPGQSEFELVKNALFSSVHIDAKLQGVRDALVRLGATVHELSEGVSKVVFAESVTQSGLVELAARVGDVENRGDAKSAEMQAGLVCLREQTMARDAQSDARYREAFRLLEARRVEDAVALGARVEATQQAQQAQAAEMQAVAEGNSVVLAEAKRVAAESKKHNGAAVRICHKATSAAAAAAKELQDSIRTLDERARALEDLWALHRRKSAESLELLGKADASLAAHAAAAASAKPAAESANGAASLLATPRVVAGGVEAGAKQDASRAEAAAAKAEQVAKTQAAAQAAAVKSADAAAARRELATAKHVHVAAVRRAKAKRSALLFASEEDAQAVVEEEVAKLQKDLWQAKVEIGELRGLCKESRSANFSEREAALEKAIGAAVKEFEAKMPPSPVSGGAASVPAAAPPEAPSPTTGVTAPGTASAWLDGALALEASPVVARRGPSLSFATAAAFPSAAVKANDARTATPVAKASGDQASKARLGTFSPLPRGQASGAVTPAAKAAASSAATPVTPPSAPSSPSSPSS
jgi:hypothetical protein